MIQITALPAFTDNYIWLLRHGSDALVVDPGDAQPVLGALRDQQLQLRGVLITHHHPDHIGGLPELLAHHDVPVYGPAAESKTITRLSHQLKDGDCLRLSQFGLEFEVIAVPGHTLGHIVYYAAEPGLLLAGDTLFSAGCGRLFEGSPEQMQRSLSRLRQLPGETQIYCAHEYTLANMAFAQQVEPNNTAIKEAVIAAENMRDESRPTLPTRLDRECKINPFLRWDAEEVIASAHAQGAKGADPVSVFAAIRAWKDRY